MKQQKKHISEINKDSFAKRIRNMIEKTTEYSLNVNDLHVFFSENNRKTDKLVPSVSLRPVLDCGNCEFCSKKCYDVRNVCCYKESQNTRARNIAILLADPDRYFNEISDYCKKQKAFRWHVGGDIKDLAYLEGMVRVANENPHCRFLVFTKMFTLVNRYLYHHEKPENLQIIFSGWLNQPMENPHNLPTSHPVFEEGTSAKDGPAVWCSGNCSDCLRANEGCWTLKNGEQVLFIAH